MGLETLEGVTEIGGFNVIHGVPTDDEGRVSWKEFYEKRKQCPIYVGHSENLISFRIQHGPIKEVGVNGCQVDTLIEAARIIIDGLNKNFPCRENSVAITKLDEALMWLEKRKRDREKRGVEGTNNV